MKAKCQMRFCQKQEDLKKYLKQEKEQLQPEKEQLKPEKQTKTYQCEWCEEIFEKKRELNSHVKINHKGKPKKISN